MEPTAQKTISPLTTGRSVLSDEVKISALPELVNVWVDEQRVHFDLADGRLIAWPITWSSLLTNASSEQRQQFTFSAYHVFWDDIDEIVGVKNILYPPAQLAA
ncbi:MAG: DUF2442 domain-containing protein [Cytophagaceae bacterium]|nr:MAG: DUF2442 domain-containing protein [Cytophagaceae bacterium]